MRVSRLLLILCWFLLIPVAGWAQTVTVDWTDQRQVIEGFGAYQYRQDASSDAETDGFWSPTSGIGLTLMRSFISSNSSSWGTNNQDSAAYMQRALQRNPNIKIWSASWSPPAAWKDNGGLLGGSLLPGHYQDYANHLASYVTTMKNTYGITIHAISIQNEPDVVADYDSCRWTETQFHDFIKNNLIPTFQSQGITAKIMMPEPTAWYNVQYLIPATLNDPVTAAGVSIIAGHDYGGRFGDSVYAPVPLAKSVGKSLWETEVSYLAGPVDPSISDGLGWAINIHRGLTNAELNSWHWWMLTQWDTGAIGFNEGLRT